MTPPLWERPAVAAVLGPEEAHVLRFPLDLASRERARAEELLAADERERAARFLSPVRRNRFVAARALLRLVLGRYLGLAPEAVALVREGGGKPALGGRHALRFNLSHSRDQALLAVAPDRDLGVDLEAVRDGVAIEDVSRGFLSPDERKELLSLPARGRQAAFFALWTRNEALLKARGGGRSGFDPAEAAGFSLLDLPPIPGFAAALAVRGGAPGLRCFAGSVRQFT